MAQLRSSAELCTCAFEMEVICVRGIILRAKHCAKTLAGAFVHHPKKFARGSIAAVPIAFHLDAPPVFQHERRHVDRLGTGMG